MANDIDFHVGRRLRRRRRLLGLTQVQLGDAIGMRFQQIQKYECGQNRVTAARLYQIALALRVPATYFFEGLPAPSASNEPDRVAAHDASGTDLFSHKETIDLVRAYYRLGERPRRRLLDLANALLDEAASAA